MFIHSTHLTYKHFWNISVFVCIYSYIFITMVYKQIEPGIIITASSRSFKFAYGIYVCGGKNKNKKNKNH